MTADFVGQASSTLNKRMTRGAVWMIGLRFVDRSIAVISTIVLARLLVPADFGLVALAMAMMATVGIFGEFGFDIALIRDQKAERSHYDTAWTLGLIRGVATAVIIALAAEPLAYFFEDSRIADVVLVLAVIPLLEGFYNVGTVAFRKNLMLNREFIFRIVPRLVGVVATVALAFTWQNYWALVCGSLIGTSVRLAMSYVMSSYRPRISLAARRDIMGFSKWILVISVASFINQKGGTFIIAKLLDAASLGIYSMARQLANMASSELLAPVKQALVPGYSKLAHDTGLLKRAFLDAYGVLVVVALPVAIGIGLTAEFFVPVLLGPKWSDVVPLIEILAISGGVRSLSSHVQPLYLAMNRPDLGAYAAVGRTLVFLPMLVFALTQYGIEGAAIAQAIGSVAVFLSSLYLMHRLLGVAFGEIWESCWRPLIACVLMVLSVGAIKWFLPISRDDVIDRLVLLAVAILIGLVTYLGSLLLLWTLCGRPVRSGESYILTYLGQSLSRRRSNVANASSIANE